MPAALWVKEPLEGGENKMCRTFKNCLFMLLILSAVMTASCAAAENSGTCGENLTWSLSDERVLTISGTGNMEPGYYPWGNMEPVSVIVEEGVTGISFMHHYELTFVSLPHSLTEISDQAFYYCNNLTDITIPDSVTRIGYQAFYCCQNLTGIVIPDSVTSIEVGAFASSGLQEIVIPDSVTEIGNGAFDGCGGALCVSRSSNLARLLGAAGYSFRDPAYPGLTLKYTGDDYSILNITGVDGSAESVEVPDEVMNIEEGVFANGPGIWYAKVGSPAAKALSGSYESSSNGTAFRDPDYPGLEFRYSGEKLMLVRVDEDAQQVTIPELVSIIETHAFSGCDSLSEVSLPDGVTEVRSGAFQGFSGILYARIGSDAARALAKHKPQAYGFRDPDYPGITLQYTGEEYTVLSLWKVDEDLETVNIPDAVSSIGNAFRDCGKLKSVVIPDGVDRIGSEAFKDCPAVRYAKIGSQAAKALGAAGYTFQDHDYPGIWLQYGKNDPSQLLVTEASKETETVDIPNGVTGIEEYAFRGCSNLIAVTMPKGLTVIGQYAFSGCSSLTAVALSEDLTIIGSNAFSNCSSLTAVALPEGLTVIEANAFSGCSSLSGIRFPDTLTSIEDYAFSYCSALTGIAFSGGLTNIGYAAFSNCSSLTSVAIPDGITVLDNTFRRCSNLKKAYIPNSVTRIEAAFEASYYEQVTIYCYEFSYAEKYANSNPNQYDCVLLDGKLNVTLPEMIYAAIGYRRQIVPEILPQRQGQKITWQSSDEGIAVIDEDGWLTAIKPGNTILTVSVDGATATSSVICGKAAEKLILPDEIWVAAKTSEEVRIRIEPEDAIAELNWKTDAAFYSTAERSVLVNADSVVEDKTLIVRDVLTGLSESAVLHICYPVTEITLSGETSVNKNGTLQLTANVTMRDQHCVNQLVKYQSSDESVATVSRDGLIRGIAPGSVTITAIAQSGVTASITIEVKTDGRTPGDANEDGKADTSDALRILQFIKDATVPINQDSADVNGDGTVDMKDAMLVLQYASGWDVELK